MKTVIISIVGLLVLVGCGRNNSVEATATAIKGIKVPQVCTSAFITDYLNWINDANSKSEALRLKMQKAGEQLKASDRSTFNKFHELTNEFLADLTSIRSLAVEFQKKYPGHECSTASYAAIGLGPIKVDAITKEAIRDCDEVIEGIKAQSKEFPKE